jgi:hypothetical protein
MEDFDSLPHEKAQNRVAIYAVIAALCLGLGGYAVYEHHTAQNLAASNVQATTALNATQSQLSDLSAKVNSLAAKNAAQEAAAAQAAQAAQAAAALRPAAGHRLDSRYKKIQAELDAQGKAIEQAQNDLTSTQGDLVNTRTELTGSIAHTHDELVLLQKRGERNYTEFDLAKSKEFKHAGPFELRLKKADGKHQFADMELMVDDRHLSQKHVNLYQPVMFYTPDSPQPVEVVINDISKDHIHGYVSASKYRQSELASMSNATENAAQGTGQDQGGAANKDDQPVQREKLPVPQE